MGVFNELKKVLFGASSIAKHGAEKAGEAGKEAAEKVGENLEHIGDQVTQKTGEQLEKAQQFTEELGGKVMNTAETVGGEVLKKAGDFWEKTKTVAEDLGGEIIEKSQMAKEAAKTMTQQAGEQVKSTAGQIGEKLDATSNKASNMANDIIDAAFQTEEKNLDATVDSSSNASTSSSIADESIVEQAQKEVAEDDSIFEQLMNKAEDLSDRLKEKVGEDKPYEPEIGYNNAKGSTLDGHDDFFERAKRFADGDYHNTGSTTKPSEDSTTIGDVEIRKNPDYKKAVNEGKVKGFEDLDGDGDEIIDDAIILDD
ncbi:MAG: hypothetical protein AAGI49_03190 [Bacteroidota bacterium]